MDDPIIQRAQRGDQLAFQQLVATYHALVWRTAQVLLSQRANIEDVVQEAWVDVWRGLPRFQRTRPFRPWLLTIVANRCRMSTRRSQAAFQPLETLEHEQNEYQDDVLARILHLEEDYELKAALKEVSAEHRRVLELRFFAELDLHAIALITNTPLGTVKSRLHRALNSLRTQLQAAEKACEETNQ